MVCHETYKDDNNKWLRPDEVDTKDGKKFFIKKNPSKKVIVGPSESMSKSKKILLTQSKLLKITVLMLLDYLCYLIVLQKKMCNGLTKA